MNTILIIGICFFVGGFILLMISMLMSSYYERKLYQLKKQFEYIKVKPKIKGK